MLWSTLRSLLWPAMIPLVSAVVYLHFAQEPDPADLWWTLSPHIFLAVGVLLAVRFGCSRVLAMAFLAWFGIHALTGSAAHDAEPLLALAGIGLLCVAIFPERGLLSWSSILMALPVTAIATYAQWPVDWQGQIHALLALSAIVEMPEWVGVSAGIVTLYLGAGFILLCRLSKTATPIDSGLFGTTIAWLLLVAHSGPNAPVYTVCLAVLVFLTALETSHALAFRDQLTGLPSRRALDRTLNRLGGRYTLAMVDVDSFKKFNDRYGHDAGDEALRMIASHLRRIRGGGRAFRYGGEEFTIVFPGRDVQHACTHLESLRKNIADARFTLRAPDRPKRRPKKPKRDAGRGRVKITVSIGAAARSNKAPCTTTVLKAADKCLYRAKRGGRNKLIAA